MQHDLLDDDDAPWDEALSYSPTSNHQELASKIQSSLKDKLDSQGNNSIWSNLPVDNMDESLPFQLQRSEETAVTTPTTLKSKSKPTKKRLKKLENGTEDPLHENLTVTIDNNGQDSASMVAESGDSSRDYKSQEAPTTSNKSRNHEKPSSKTSSSSKKSTRDSLKDDAKPLSFKNSKPRDVVSGEVSPATSTSKASRKSKIDSKVSALVRSPEEQPLVTKTKTKGSISRSTAKEIKNGTRMSLSSNVSLADQLPDLASSDTSESKDIMVDDRSLGSLNSALMDSVTSLESQSHGGLGIKGDRSASNGKKDRRSKQRSEGSMVFPTSLQALSTTFSAPSNASDDRGKSALSKDADTPKHRLTARSSSKDNDPQAESDSETSEQYTPELQDLMPPFKRKSSKVNQHETKNEAINAAEILKKKIMQMNEQLRLKAFNGNSSSSLHSAHSGDEMSLHQSLSSKSDHGITTRRPRRTLSGNAEKLRQSCPSPTPSDSDDTPKTPRRRKSLDGSSTRQRERLDSSTVKEVRRRLKTKGKEEESDRSNKSASKSPKRNIREGAHSSSRSLAKSEANTTSQEFTTVISDPEAPTTTTPQSSSKPGKIKPTSSRKLNAKDGNKATSTSSTDKNIDVKSPSQLPENSTGDVKETTPTSGKTNKSPKAHRKNKETKPISQPQLFREKERAYSFTSADKIESIQKKELKMRSRSQSPSRKGKRQPKSLLNPETLDAWQISQQQKHRVTPFPSVYCRRLDDDDDDGDLNPALLLPPAFRQLQVGQKPKSSRF